MKKYIKLNRKDADYKVNKLKKGFWQLVFTDDAREGEVVERKVRFRPELKTVNDDFIVLNKTLISGQDAMNLDIFIVGFKPENADAIEALLNNVSKEITSDVKPDVEDAGNAKVAMQMAFEKLEETLDKAKADAEPKAEEVKETVAESVETNASIKDEPVKPIVEEESINEDKSIDVDIDDKGKFKVSAKGLLTSSLVTVALVGLAALSVRFLNRNM